MAIEMPRKAELMEEEEAVPNEVAEQVDLTVDITPIIPIMADEAAVVVEAGATIAKGGAIREAVDIKEEDAPTHPTFRLRSGKR
jgi:hypothetical protein